MRKIATSPLFTSSISAGFPSPADDFVDKKLDLNEHLIRHPAATFFVRVDGDSMVDAGIHPGDLIIVDRSLHAKDRQIIVAVLHGEFTIKRLCLNEQGAILVPENPLYPSIVIEPDADFQVWGVVTYVIHHVCTN